MEYTFKIKKENEIESASKAEVKYNNWNNPYAPKTEFCGIFVEKSGFIIKMLCFEKEPKRDYRNCGDPVYRDSCMEAFFNFAPEKSNYYINLEMNANGVCLCGVGVDRHGRKQITDFGVEYPKINVEIENDKWSVTAFISLDIIEKIYGKQNFVKGYHFKGNFYKCGDDTEIKHYLSWNPIGTEKPDFHRPEFFGDLYLG